MTMNSSNQNLQWLDVSDFQKSVLAKHIPREAKNLTKTMQEWDEFQWESFHSIMNNAIPTCFNYSVNIDIIPKDLHPKNTNSYKYIICVSFSNATELYKYTNNVEMPCKIEGHTANLLRSQIKEEIERRWALEYAKIIFSMKIDPAIYTLFPDIIYLDIPFIPAIIYPYVVSPFNIFEKTLSKADIWSMANYDRDVDSVAKDIFSIASCELRELGICDSLLNLPPLVIRKIRERTNSLVQNIWQNYLDILRKEEKAKEAEQASKGRILSFKEVVTLEANKEYEIISSPNSNTANNMPEKVKELIKLGRSVLQSRKDLTALYQRRDKVYNDIKIVEKLDIEKFDYVYSLGLTRLIERFATKNIGGWAEAINVLETTAGLMAIIPAELSTLNGKVLSMNTIFLSSARCDQPIAVRMTKTFGYPMTLDAQTQPIYACSGRHIQFLTKDAIDKYVGEETKCQRVPVLVPVTELNKLLMTAHEDAINEYKRKQKEKEKENTKTDKD